MQQKCTKFSERLTELRERANLSRQQLADVLGVSRASLEYYEKGKRTPDIDVLYKLSEYFNVTSDYLIGRTNKSGESTDVNAICSYTGLSEKAVRILNCMLSYYDETIKIINFFIEETDIQGDIENGIFSKRNLLDTMYNYFFCNYRSSNNPNDDLIVTSLGRIFTSFEQYEASHDDVIKEWSDTDLAEMKTFRISKNEILESVYINRIIDQLKLTKENFKELNNGND